MEQCRALATQIQSRALIGLHALVLVYAYAYATPTSGHVWVMQQADHPTPARAAAVRLLPPLRAPLHEPAQTLAGRTALFGEIF